MVIPSASAAIAASLASGGVEKVGFLNDIVEQLWDYINVAGGNMTKEIVEPMFKEMLPTPLNSLHFTKIDLGKKPIKFDNIDVHSRNEGVIKLDVDVIWDGECDIELKASIIGGFGVEKVKLHGRISILLCPLVERMPLVTAAQIAFISPPQIELDFTGLADIADCSLIDGTIRKIIHKVLASILVLPNRLLVKIDPLNDYYKTYQQHLGVIRLTVDKATGFKTPKGFFKDIPDVFCKLQMGAHPEVRTKTINNDTKPQWNESFDFLLSDHDQRIEVHAIDDDLAGDDKLGTAMVTVNELLLAGSSKDLPFLIKDKESGACVTIKCEIMPFTEDLTSFESELYKGKNYLCGLVTILIAGAKKIPGDKETAATMVKVKFGKEQFQTPLIMNMPGVDALNPSFDASFRVLLTSELAADASDISLTLISRKDTLGTLDIKFNDVVSAPSHTIVGEHPIGDGPALDFKINIAGLAPPNK